MIRSATVETKRNEVFRSLDGGPIMSFDVLDRAHAALRSTAARVTLADLTRPTPCSLWSVAQVLQHAAGDQRAYAFFLTGSDGPTGDPFAPDGVLHGTPL